MNSSISNHIRPFLWYANEKPSVVCNTLDIIAKSGISEVILENRGGDWWGTEAWWNMLNAVLEHCREIGMRLWLLDDSHVGTGSANDSLKKPENAKFRPVNLRLSGMDWAYSICGGAIRLPDLNGDEKLLRILAFPIDESNGDVLPEPIDLSDKIVDELCIAELPEGRWRIYFVIQTSSDASGFFSYYITMLNHDSCRHLIDEIHEKVYEHCGKYFGNTFAGFFSDEPSFGNCNGDYDYESRKNRIGEMFRRVLAWDKDMPRLLAEELNMSPEQVWLLFPAFLDEVKDLSLRFRLAYMNVITRLWKKNFSEQLGDWCREHKVEYIGHVLEDDVAHMHFGFGCGHFFRSMAGQDMAGWDIVLGQMIPFGTRLAHLENRFPIQENFYQYTLPKLAASLGHHTPRMNNRVICEVMGGYGWAAGVSYMKYLFSFCLANGTNQFVPHEFSMFPPLCFAEKARADMDLSSLPPGYCLTYLPPAFHACGFNPQYPAITQMFAYIQRVARMLSTGKHVPDVALYYGAEADWFHGKAQSLDCVAAEITRNGLDFDYLDYDMLFNPELSVEDNAIVLHGECYKALVVPYSEYQPLSLMKRLAELAALGANIVFVDGVPSECVCDSDKSTSVDMSSFQTVALTELHSALMEFRHIIYDKNSSGLRFYHLAKGDNAGIVVFFNESSKKIDSLVHSNDIRGNIVVYDAWHDEYLAPQTGEDDALRLRIAPLQLLVVEYGQNVKISGLRPFLYDDCETKPLPLKYDIFIKEVTEKDFSLLLENSPAVNLLVAKSLTRTCAEFKYVSEFTCNEPENVKFIRIPHCCECIKMYLNGEEYPWECGPSAQFDVRGKLIKGINKLEFLTADSPAYADRFEGSGKACGERLPLSSHGFIGDLVLGY